jgi:hypothetical protein
VCLLRGTNFRPHRLYVGILFVSSVGAHVTLLRITPRPHYQNTGAGHDHGERGTRGTVRVLLRNRQLNNAMLPCDNRIIISAVAGEGICN